MVPQRHRNGRDVRSPRMLVLFEAGTHRRRKRRVSEGADSHAGPGGIGLSEVVNGRPAYRAEMTRDHISRRISGDAIRAGAGAIPSRLRALDGELPRGRFAFDRHLLVWESRLDGERAARLPLAQEAVAHDDSVRVGAFGGNGELSAIARSHTGFDFRALCGRGISCGSLHAVGRSRLRTAR